MTENEDRGPGPSAGSNAGSSVGSNADELLGRVEVIEAQPLEERAIGFEQLHDELLAELQRGDRGGA
ncbi:hypothetical protein [Leucobacter luti]|uniref:hypothetical protein n=1 Tax=Leucobacter luti TaxID=340320 RepID=UPI003D012DCF